MRSLFPPRRTSEGNITAARRPSAQSNEPLGPVTTRDEAARLAKAKATHHPLPQDTLAPRDLAPGQTDASGGAKMPYPDLGTPWMTTLVRWIVAPFCH